MNFKILLRIVFCAAILYLLVMIIYFSLAFNFIVHMQPVTNADAEVVFFHGFDKKKNQLDAYTVMRLDHALNLYRNGCARYIVCIGGYRGKHFIGSFYMKQYLVEKGIKPGFIFTDPSSFDSKTNCREALKIIDACHFRSVILVSSPLHLYRLSKIMKKDNLFYSTYSFRSLKGYFQLFIDAHGELLAFASSFIIPENIYLRLVKWYRFS